MKSSATSTETAKLGDRGSGFPLLAVLHLMAVLALLLGCLNRKNIEFVMRETDVAVEIAVFAACLGALVGVCVGLNTVRRVRASLFGAAVGGLAALLAAGLICSAEPLRLLIASAAIFTLPALIQARRQ